MPERGLDKREHSDILRVEEILEIVAAAATLGITKVRITGGEPLVRRGFLDICNGIANISGIKELTLTTNGILLGQYAQQLKDAGVQRVNVSLDTLDPERFRLITRGGNLISVLNGIEKAIEVGLVPVKINAVLMRGVNDGEISAFAELAARLDAEVRFIELMPIGEALPMWQERYLSNDYVLKQLASHAESHIGVADVFELPGGRGRIGLIDPVSRKFCGSCNRIRLTADGKLKPCLHGSTELNIRGLHGNDLTTALKNAILSKPAAHDGLTADAPSKSLRGMERIGG
jgi:cyclic pyranopterin phosphate synthase